jgi:hypothetical protein
MKIKLNIPEYATTYDDWTDNELLFLSFMFYVYNKKGCRLEYGYHFWSNDMSAILGLHNTSSTDVLNQRFTKLRRLFRIALVNNHCYRVRWTAPGNDYHFKRAEVYITDPKAINTYYYLAGRCTDSEIIDHTTDQPHSYVVKGRDRVPASKQNSHWRQRNRFKL